MTEKDRRDRFVLNALHPGIFDPLPEEVGPYSPEAFSPGVRQMTPSPPRPAFYRDEDGWWTAEVDARLIFGESD
jgi:hypothetical protein